MCSLSAVAAFSLSLPWCAVAIAPFYIGVAGGSSDSLKILRLARSFRLLKLSRYSTGFTVVKNALVASSDALQLFVLVLVMVLIVFSSAIYYMERGTWNPDTKYYYRTSNVGYWGDMPPEGTNPSPFQSIPHSFWWCMVTLTTVRTVFNCAPISAPTYQRRLLS